jgi:prophage regulatory protein
MHQIIRANRISAVVGLSRRHIERLANEGSFPKKLRIGPNSSGWLAAEVAAWIETRIAARDQAAVA